MKTGKDQQFNILNKNLDVPRSYRCAFNTINQNFGVSFNKNMRIIIILLQQKGILKAP